MKNYEEYPPLLIINIFGSELGKIKNWPTQRAVIGQIKALIKRFDCPYTILDRRGGLAVMLVLPYSAYKTLVLDDEVRATLAAIQSIRAHVWLVNSEREIYEFNGDPTGTVLVPANCRNWHLRTKTGRLYRRVPSGGLS